MINLFNSVSKSKQEFTAQNPVSIYTCGPTVYLDPHIGNWRTFIFYDTLVRTLKLSDHDVRHVINITDVGHLVSDGDTGDDKMSKTAAAQRKTAWEVADHYTKIFIDGMRDLNLLKPYKLPKATDHIPQQIEMIKDIEKADYTYTIDDGVYFDTAKFKDYGSLAGGVKADADFARINQNDEKRNLEDFALWKFSPKDEARDMEWESPWGTGFPGWHIECSAMAKAYLGNTIDIHAGGVDHIPVHHTNEIAQSETANGVTFSDVWMHAEFMKVDGGKMSKSKNNFFTLQDVEDQGFTHLEFRFLILQGHYRTETNFTWDNLQNAANTLKNIRSAYDRIFITPSVISSQPQAAAIEESSTNFISALNDDLNTPSALSALNAVASLATTGEGLAADNRQAFIEFFLQADKALGLKIVELASDITDGQKQLIEQREQAKADKNFDLSDKLRDQLLEQNIALLDNAAGTIWQRT